MPVNLSDFVTERRAAQVLKLTVDARRNVAEINLKPASNSLRHVKVINIARA